MKTVPRWQKATQISKQSECYIKTCKEIAKHNSSDTNFSNSLSAANLKLKYDEIPSSIPLCNQHYHVIYNLHQPTQTHCITCNMWLKRNARSCPSPNIIEALLRQNTDFNSHIRSSDKVCYSCYKSHLILLQRDKPINTLTELISSYSSKLRTLKS